MNSDVARDTTPQQATDGPGQAAPASCRQQTFLGRHPFAGFLIAPIPLTLVGWIVFLVAGFGLLKLSPYVLGSAYHLQGKTVDQWPPAAVWSALAFHSASRIVPPLLIAGLLCHLAHRSGLQWRWAMLASTLVALVAAMYTSSMQLPLEPGKGRFSIGLGFGQFMLRPSQALQAVLPLATGLAFLARWRRHRGPVVHV